MFLSLISSFFTGSIARVIWGEVSSWFSARQDHKQEMERMRLQGELDEKAHARMIEVTKLQAELQVQTIRVQGDVDLSKIDAESFGKGVENLAQKGPYKWIDGWKSLVIPLLATEILVMLALHYHQLGWKLDDRGWELAGSILGLFTADRMLFRRGK